MMVRGVHTGLSKFRLSLSFLPMLKWHSSFSSVHFNRQTYELWQMFLKILYLLTGGREGKSKKKLLYYVVANITSSFWSMSWKYIILCMSFGKLIYYYLLRLLPHLSWPKGRFLSEEINLHIDIVHTRKWDAEEINGFPKLVPEGQRSLWESQLKTRLLLFFHSSMEQWNQ